MENVVAIIDRIIEEHKMFLVATKTLEKVANDASAMMAIEKGKEVFMPGRFSSQQGLHQLEDLRAKLETGLEAHFNMEETKLLEAFQEYNDRNLLTALQTLLEEHNDIRNRLSELKGHIAELMTENLARHLWESKAYDMRAHMTNIHKVIEAHARAEQVILNKLRRELIAAQET